MKSPSKIKPTPVRREKVNLTGSNALLPKWLTKLEVKVSKDFGEPCKGYEPFCFVCRAWEAMAILEDLYSKGVEKL